MLLALEANRKNYFYLDVQVLREYPKHIKNYWKKNNINFANDVEEVQACDVKLALTQTENDIYGDIPTVEILQGWYTPKLHMHAKSKYLTTVDKEEFLPYAFSKVDPYDCYNR